MMYQAEAYILMFAEVGCALGLIIMNGKGALKNTVGLAIAFVCYVILLGTVWNYFVIYQVSEIYLAHEKRDFLSYFLFKTVEAAFHVKTPHYPYYIADLFWLEKFRPLMWLFLPRFRHLHRVILTNWLENSASVQNIRNFSRKFRLCNNLLEPV